MRTFPLMKNWWSWMSHESGLRPPQVSLDFITDIHTIPLIENDKVLLKYIPYLKTILKFIGKILSEDRYINNGLYVTFSCTGWNSSVEVPIIRNFFSEIYFSKWSPHFLTLEKFLLQIDKTMIFFWENINDQKEKSIRQQRIFLCEINLSKWKPHVDTL